MWKLKIILWLLLSACAAAEEMRLRLWDGCPAGPRLLLRSPGRRMRSTRLPAFWRLILVTEGAVSAWVTTVQPHDAGCFVSGPSH